MEDKLEVDYNPNNTSEQYKLSLLASDILINTLSKTFILCSSIRLRDQVSQPYKIGNKIFCDSSVYLF